MSEQKKRLRHLNIQISTELYDEFREMVPWGLRGHLFDAILRLIMEAIREEGQIIAGAIMAGEYKLSLSRNRNSMEDSNDR